MMKRERHNALDDQGTECSQLVACHRSKKTRCILQSGGINQGYDTSLDQLPEHLLVSILSYLSLRNVAQTSIVSRHFKNAACSMPGFKLDLHNIFGTEEEKRDVIIDEGAGSCFCGEYRERFIHGVDQYIMTHQAKSLLDLTLSFCLGCYDKDYIDRWIRFALIKEVVTLNLCFCCDRARNTYEDLYYYDSKYENMYVLSAELFGGLSTKLRTLQLAFCELGPGFTAHFPGLSKLVLCNIPLHEHDLQSMFLCLPKLLDLKFKGCTLPVKLSLGALPKLRCICIEECSGIEDIEVSNAALLGFRVRARQVVRCSINEAPNLRGVGYTVDSDGLSYTFTYLARDFPSLRALYVYTSSDWGKSICQSMRSFNQLLRLTLFIRTERFDIMKLNYLLQASPRLKRFILKTNSRVDVELENDNLKLGDHVNRHLTEALITGLFTSPGQIKFITHLVEHSPALMKLSIQKGILDECYGIHRFRWGKGQLEKFLDQLEQFSNFGFIISEAGTSTLTLEAVCQWVNKGLFDTDFRFFCCLRLHGIKLSFILLKLLQPPAMVNHQPSCS